MMELADQIAQSRNSAEEASTALLKTLAATPDGKLVWSPSETARTPLWIVGHCAEANRAFARGIRGESFPPMDPAEFGKMVWLAGRDTASREEAVRLLEESTDEILLALDALTPDKANGMVQTPFGPLPITLWMTFAGGHMMGHGNQIEYIQTIWGDHVNHMM